MYDFSHPMTGKLSQKLRNLVSKTLELYEYETKIKEVIVSQVLVKIIFH